MLTNFLQSAKVKGTRHDADDKAETLYGMQQTANRQRSQLDNKCDNLATNTETRQELENLAQELQEMHKLEQSNVQAAQTCGMNKYTVIY
jgi:cell shape-determining protein MreC